MTAVLCTIGKRSSVANVSEMLDDPGFLESLAAGATRAALTEGQRTTLTLRTR